MFLKRKDRLRLPCRNIKPTGNQQVSFTERGRAINALPFVLTNPPFYVKIFEINRSIFPGRNSGLLFYRIHTHLSLIGDYGKRSHAPGWITLLGFLFF